VERRYVLAAKTSQVLDSELDEEAVAASEIDTTVVPVLRHEASSGAHPRGERLRLRQRVVSLQAVEDRRPNATDRAIVEAR